MLPLILRPGRAIAAASLLGTFLAIAPLPSAGTLQAGEPTQMTAGHGKHRADRSEARIKELHEKLHITPAQEELWGTVAQTMRDNAAAFRASAKDRESRLKGITAIDDLKSFQIITNQHSEGLKRLIPAFEALYDAMTPDQKKNADRVFGEHQRHTHHI